jgi:hypothetical protein
MTIRPIVEGQGEVAAVPKLLARLALEAGVYDLRVSERDCIRANLSELSSPDRLARRVELARLSGPDAILVLFDADERCPVELVTSLQRAALEAARGTPCQVVIAKSEFESWFLAAMESLRGHCGIAIDAPPVLSPEEPRDAKSRLESAMPRQRAYKPTTDQVILASRFDMGMAYSRSRSFRKLVKAFGELLSQSGRSPLAWPPAHWTTSS